MKLNKKLKWVLLDQYHIDIEIRSDMPASNRKKILKTMKELPLASYIWGSFMIEKVSPDQVRVNIRQ